MTNETEIDIYSNERFVTFQSFLEKCGFTLRCLWETNAGNSRYADVICFQVVGTPEKKPEVGTIIVRNYGTDGYGIWFDRREVQYQADSWHIAGHNVPKPRCIVAIGAYCWGVGTTVLEALENAKKAGHPAGEIGKACYECFDAPEGAYVDWMGSINWVGMEQPRSQSIGFFDVKFRPVPAPAKKEG